MISQFVLVTSAVEFVREPEPGQREAEFVRQPAVEFVSEPEPGLSQREAKQRESRESARAHAAVYVFSYTIIYMCACIFMLCIYYI